MAIYTIILSSGSGAVTSIDTLYVRKDTTFNYDFAYSTYEKAQQGFGYDIDKITPPTWSGGTKVFAGYYDSSGNLRISTTGSIRLKRYGTDVPFVTANGTWTALWNNACPTATISKNSGTGGTDEIYYSVNDGKWYLDYPFTTELSASHPLTIPTRAQYQFIGCYSANNTTSTKYINADGTPTADFLALTPTDDITIYAQWQQVSYKVTVSHANGTPTSTIFYAKIGETGNDRFFSDDLCTNVIHSITPPSRELYSWNGAFSTSTQSAANTYINSAGEFQSLLYSLSITANKTISYANYWTQVSYKLTLTGTGWSIPVSNYYIKKTGGGIYADWLCETTELTNLPIPSRASYLFLGYYSTNATTGTQYVDGDGLISSSLKSRTAATTIYAQGRKSSIALTLDANGGTGGSTIYYDATTSAFFGPESSVITSVTPPTYTGNAFLGYFTESSGGTQVITAQGVILSSWVPTASATVYAHWGIDVSIIDVDAGEGSGGTARFWYRGVTGKFYADAELTNEITSVTLPTKPLFNTTGLYDEGNVLRVSSSGTISAWIPSGEFVALHAQYDRRCYAVTILTGGGGGSLPAIYRAPSGSTWHSDDTLTQSVTNVGVPTRTGYTFGGFTYSGTQVINASGVILPAAVVNEDYTATASWTVRTFTISFNYMGGTPGIASKSVTFGTAIGQLPSTSKAGGTFDGWYVDGVKITASTVYAWGENVTALATFNSYFGRVTDYFSLGSAWLVPESSDSGDNRQRVAVRHYGKTESDVNATSGVWRNPSVSYRVISTGTLNVTLGKAFSGSSGVSGYMITSVSVSTKLGDFPTVTVSAVANEGRDAINSFPVSFQILGRARPQKLMSPFSGGGELQELSLVASCDPVVVAENMMPCASDVVNGRITVNATTGAYNNEAEPTASNGFTQVGAPIACGGTAYKQWRVNLIKEI